jgi:ankyrin repeat protein
MPATEYMYSERVHIHGDILSFNYSHLPKPDVILIAVPCTDFALSGSRYFAAKDSDGRTASSIALVQKALEIVNYFKPRVWALENPMSRIHTLVPELGSPRLKFDPWEYGALANPPETRWKKTWIWGDFNIPNKAPATPDPKDSTGNNPWNNKVGGKSEKTKEFRSQTPIGFAKAFAEANYDNTLR